MGEWRLFNRRIDKTDDEELLSRLESGIGLGSAGRGWWVVGVRERHGHYEWVDYPWLERGATPRDAANEYVLSWGGHEGKAVLRVTSVETGESFDVDVVLCQDCGRVL